MSSPLGKCRTTGRSIPTWRWISVCGTTTTRYSGKAICRRARRFRWRSTGRGEHSSKADGGLFFDQVFLQVDAYDQFQQRIEQDFNGTADAPAAPPVVFDRRVDGELEEPTSRVWNIEFDQQLGTSVLFRVNYLENRARGRLVVNRVVDGAGAALALSSTDRLIGREFDATLRWTLPDRGDLYVSFSKIRTKGNLNDFGVLYDNLREPLVLENE